MPQRGAHMFGFWTTTTTTAALVAVAVVAILAFSRVLSIYIAVRGVPPEQRAKVLKALAQCHRWWRWRD